MYHSPFNTEDERLLTGVDKARLSNDKIWKFEAAYTTDVINWVSRTRSSIKEETIVHLFLVCGISNALDGSQDDAMSSDIPIRLKKTVMILEIKVM